MPAPIGITTPRSPRHHKKRGGGTVTSYGTGSSPSGGHTPVVSGTPTVTTTTSSGRTTTTRGGRRVGPTSLSPQFFSSAVTAADLLAGEPVSTNSLVAKLTGQYLAQELATPKTPKDKSRAAKRPEIKPQDLLAALEGTRVVRGKKGTTTYINKGTVATKQKGQPTKVVAVGGRKTLGTPTLRSVKRANRQEELKTNKGGKVTTPQTRGAVRNLKQARRRYRREARPNLAGLSP